MEESNSKKLAELIERQKSVDNRTELARIIYELSNLRYKICVEMDEVKRLALIDVQSALDSARRDLTLWARAGID